MRRRHKSRGSSSAHMSRCLASRLTRSYRKRTLTASLHTMLHVSGSHLTTANFGTVVRSPIHKFGPNISHGHWWAKHEFVSGVEFRQLHNMRAKAMATFGWFKNVPKNAKNIGLILGIPFIGSTVLFKMNAALSHNAGYCHRL
ncbi:MAG: hypothetical protein MHM6MM_002101 [Cercozoa sp. M6MM]